MLYAGQAGFLSAAEGDAGKSRFAAIEAAGLPAPMPEVDDDLIGAAQSLGWCGYSGMGPSPLSAQEVLAWCEGTGERLTHWEFATLRGMSRAFVEGTQAKHAPYQGLAVRMALATASFTSSPSR